MPPILNIIHTCERIERRQSFMTECNEQNIAFNVWDGITVYKDTVRNISASHKAIVRVAKEKKWPYVIIAEDDIKFSAKGAWKYYLSQMPEDFDLYCGVLYDGLTEGNRIISTRGMSGTNTLYCVAERFYEFFLSVDESKNLDRELGKFGNINTYILCNPMVCYQANGFSSHFQRNMNYDAYLEGKKLYGQ